jgi:hypothetical protein
MHGPRPYPQPFANAPRITVIDTMAKDLRAGSRARRRWRDVRNKALLKWEQADIELYVVEGDPDAYPKYDVNDPAYSRWVWYDEADHSKGGYMVGDDVTFAKKLLLPGVIRLMSMPENWMGGAVAGVGWLYEEGGLAIYNKKAWVANDRPMYITAHEIGHALGLAHAKQADGGTPDSIMYTSTKGFGSGSVDPNYHDLDTVRRMYNP